MADNDKVTSPELAVLYERIGRVLDDYQELRGMVISQNAAIQQFAVIQKDISILDAKTDRLFKAISAQGDLTSEHGAKLQTHSAIWKIVGTVALACTGLVGWSYSTIENLRAADNAADRRIMALEYKLDVSEQLKKGWSNGRPN
uniref:K(+)-stimulated pyrophosphate-energized sodium pump n=1 Tax=Pseudomonas phage Pavpe01 TaxID=3138545 RepID=A0AAU6W0H9_9VIRU